MTSSRLTCRKFLMASAAMSSVAAASPAWAQVQEQQPPPQEDASAADTDPAEIIITAQKREERILDIPQSVTVLSGDNLERQNATNFQDYVNQVPGLSLEQDEPGVGRLVLRGVNTGGTASTVAVYIDETPFGSSSGLANGAILAGDFDTFDIARVEVLRGPQGTLYGASSLGGVLKFVTNTPQLNRMSGRARAGLEFVDDGGTGYNANGVVNVPLGGTAALRATGFYRKRAGWVDAGGEGITLVSPFGNTLDIESREDDDINSSKVYGGRASLLVKPSEPLTVRLTAIAQNIKSNGGSGVDVDGEDYDPVDGLQRQSFVREPNRLKYRLFNGVLDYDLGFATLVSSTSFGRQNQGFRDDLTGAFGSAINLFFGPLNPNLPAGFPLPVTDETVGVFQDQQTNLRKFTQEVRLASPSNDTLEWLVGGYYTRERGLIDQFIGGLALDTGTEFTDAVLGDLATATLQSRYREIAGFTNVTWHITDRFDLTGGGRLSRNKQSAIQSSAGQPVLVGAGGTLPAIESKESVFTYSVSPRFELSDNSAIYARVAKGYRPGGPNVVPPTAGPDVPRSYDADTITSFEAGFKTDIGRRVSLDLAVYHLKWDDIQLFTVIDNFGLNANGGSARSNGFEGTLNLRPMRGLSFNLNAALIDAKLTADTPPFVGGFDGDRLPFVPRTSFSASADYEWNAGRGITPFVGATVAYTGRQRGNFLAGTVTGVDPDGEFTFAFSDQRRVRSYATVDLRAGAEFGRFSLEAFARNITNARGVTGFNELTDEITGANPLPDGNVQASILQPRTIGFTLGAEF
jgi:outer membrane receptor protein involved in Fe transport